MTFEEGHKLLLKNFEMCFNHLLGIHLDWDFVDDDSDEYTDAMDEFIAIQQQIFHVKQLASYTNRVKKDLED